MHRNKIILISALIILVFAVLFVVEKPHRPPKSEAENVIKEYRGMKDFVILSLPKFLIEEIIPEQHYDIIKNKKAVHTVKVLIYHEKKNSELKKKAVHSNLQKKLKKMDFYPIDSLENKKEYKEIYQKEKDYGWNESVMIFSSDSSLFLFDIINNLPAQKIVEFADSINTDKINFN